jgi:Holliday junction resolvasome RuvABC endonuclease subunit
MILGLDCSLNKTGWCVRKIDDGCLISYGKFIPKDPQSGNLLNDRLVKTIQTSEFLAGVVADHDIHALAFESESYLSLGTVCTLARNMGFVLGYLYFYCGDVIVFEVAPASVKATAKKGNSVKATMVEYFQKATGLKDVSDDDIADAYFLCEYGIRKIRSGVS